MRDLIVHASFKKSSRSLHFLLTSPPPSPLMLRAAPLAVGSSRPDGPRATRAPTVEEGER
eukprot:5853764-Pyramimonas_sp.AAC.1